MNIILKLSILSLFTIINGLIYSQEGVAINTSGNDPNQSAMLDIVATDKGLLIPRIALTATNSTAPVTSPETSLLVYNTATTSTGSNDVSEGYYYWNGTLWTPLVSPGSGGTDSQTLSLVGNTLSITNGNNVTLIDNVNDADSDITNEIQTITKTGSTVTLSDGGGTFTDDDTQLTETQVDGFANNNNYLTAVSATPDSITYTTSAGTSITVAHPINDNDWRTTGNTGTTAGTNFLGTIDNQPLSLKVNNVEKVRIETNGTISTLNTGGSVFHGQGTGLNDDLSDNRNVFVGAGTGEQNTTGYHNTAIGDSALHFNTTADFNVGVGNYALFSNTSGTQNVALGAKAMENNTTGSFNSSLGTLALRSNTTGGFNTAIGYLTLSASTATNFNTAIGSRGLQANTTGEFNTAVGSSSLSANTAGAYNTGLGYSALSSNTVGNYNTGLGYLTLSSNTSDFNTSIGVFGLTSNTTGSFNTAVGGSALGTNTTGIENTAVGAASLLFNTTGGNNTAVGRAALQTNTTGGFNTAVGRGALFSNTTANENTAVGFASLVFNTIGAQNTAIGVGSLQNNTTGSNNVGLGRNALFTATTADDNTAVGALALQLTTTGTSNVAIGKEALEANTIGNNNTATGKFSLPLNTTGNNNTAMGFQALNSNVGGSFNTAVGRRAFFANSNFSNSTALGNNSVITASNQIRIGDAAVTSIGGFSAWTNLSDARFKKNISEDVIGLDFILKLRPVTYNLDLVKLNQFLEIEDPENESRLSIEAISKKEKEIQSGFIAQEVEKTASESGYKFSGVVTPKNEKDHYGLKYSEFVVPLVKATQEQQIIIEKQQQEIDQLKSQIKTAEKLEKRVLLLEELVKNLSN